MTRRKFGAGSVLAFLLLLTGCGGNHQTGPSPTPTPTQTHIAGTITDTMTGASVGSFSSDTSIFPARVSVSLAGYLTRETWVRSASPTVDLIQDAAPFDLGFYRQLVRNGYESPGALDSVRVLAQAPSIYLQTAGLSVANVAALEAAARQIVPAMTGGKFTVQAWETGPDVRAPSTGWIVVELANDDGNCGRSFVGAPAGHIWLNTAAKCARGGNAVTPTLLSHEIGHALGFSHVGRTDALMNAITAGTPLETERYHAAIAYHRNAGNLDVDVDSVSSSPARTLRVVD